RSEVYISNRSGTPPQDASDVVRCASMEITARELRDVEIREAFRGYHRDDVNDLLERAASTIDAANERIRQMSERLSTAQADSGRSRETEDILHRTLLLAQRAADDAVAQAQRQARQTAADAETQSGPDV